MLQRMASSLLGSHSLPVIAGIASPGLSLVCPLSDVFQRFIYLVDQDQAKLAFGQARQCQVDGGKLAADFPDGSSALCIRQACAQERNDFAIRPAALALVFIENHFVKSVAEYLRLLPYVFVAAVALAAKSARSLVTWNIPTSSDRDTTVPPAALMAATAVSAATPSSATTVKVRELVGAALAGTPSPAAVSASTAAVATAPTVKRLLTTSDPLVEGRGVITQHLAGFRQTSVRHDGDSLPDPARSAATPS